MLEGNFFIITQALEETGGTGYNCLNEVQCRYELHFLINAIHDVTLYNTNMKHKSHNQRKLMVVDSKVQLKIAASLSETTNFDVTKV